jgi:glycerol kinase (EC 2.7.1.30)
MSDSAAVLAIDQGTSSTKALVFDEDGTVLAQASRSVRPTYLGDGAVEQDAEEMWRSVVEAGREAVAASGTRINRVALANQGESVLAWDRADGSPLTPVIVWQDRRSEPLCTEVADVADAVRAKTGLLLDPYFSAPKMAWIRRDLTDRGVITTTDSWLLHRLTGAFVTDASTASRSLVLDLASVTWDPTLLDVFGLGEEELPEIVDNNAHIGTTRAFGAEMEVCGAIVDQQAALLAEGCTRPGTSKCTFGTGAFYLANVGSDIQVRDDGLSTSVAWREGGNATYCLDGQIYTAGSAVRWMSDLGLIGEAADMDRVADPDTGDLLVVPALAGLGAPWWSPRSKAAIRGLDMSVTAGKLVMAVLQGIAAQVALLGASAPRPQDGGTPFLKVDGGLTRCATLMQAVADIAQVRVDVYSGSNATAMGAALCARSSGGGPDALVNGVPAMEASTSYLPHWEDTRAADFLEQWTQLTRTALDVQEGR